jgi:hypothetical protein
MKTVVLLGVLVLLLLFLSWRNPTEHMTLIKGIPVVDQGDVNALLPLWKPDPVALQKQKDNMATVMKARMCAINKKGDLNAANTMQSGTIEQQLVRATAYIAANNC